MSEVTMKGNPVQVGGSFAQAGQAAPALKLTAGDFSEKTLADFSGKRKILNIFPSVDTGVCAKSVRVFNEKAAVAANAVVLCISQDLPFAQARFCGAEGIENVVMLSAFRSPAFAQDYGVALQNGPLAGLTARAVVVLDEQDKVVYSQLVAEITEEPDYEAALAALA